MARENLMKLKGFFLSGGLTCGVFCWQRGTALMLDAGFLITGKYSVRKMRRKNGGGARGHTSPCGPLGAAGASVAALADRNHRSEKQLQRL